MCTSYLVWGDGPFVGNTSGPLVYIGSSLMLAIARYVMFHGTHAKGGKGVSVNQRLRLVTWVRCIPTHCPLLCILYSALAGGMPGPTGMSPPPSHTYMGRVEHGVLCNYVSKYRHSGPLCTTLLFPHQHASGGQRATSESCAGAVINARTHARITGLT